MENNIDEDINILQDYLKTLEKSGDLIKSDEIIKFIEYKEIKAIKNILSELEDYKSQKIYHCMQNEILNLTKELKKYKNMYNAEHEIHLVRNEQLERKERGIQKAKEIELENIKLKSELETLKENKRIAEDNYVVLSQEVTMLTEPLGLEEDALIEEMYDEIRALKRKLETYKKIAEKLAEEGKFDNDKYCESNIFSCNAKTPKKTCKQCIIDWARKEVEK